MRPAWYWPAGNSYAGRWYKSAIELPARGENPGPLVWWTFAWGPLALLFHRMAELPTPEGWNIYFQPTWVLLKWAFLISFGVHYCLRYTLMQEDNRLAALVAFFVLGIPLTFLDYSWLLPLLAPKKCWQALVSWFSYPDHTLPGQFRRPLRIALLRALISAPLIYFTCLAAIAPAMIFTEHDDA